METSSDEGSVVPAIIDFAQATRSELGFPSGRVLEVGSLNVNGTVRDVFADAAEYIGIDLAPGPGVDRVMDAHDILKEFGPSSFDTVICCEMLEHDPMPWVTVPQLHGVLRSGGHLLVTTPTFGFPLHRYPKDYWRFGEDAFREFIFASMAVLKLEHVHSHPIVCCIGRKPGLPQVETSQPDVCIVTVTGDRPEAFALTERWMGRAIRNFEGSSFWLVVDDGQSPTSCNLGQAYVRRSPQRGEVRNTKTLNLRAALDSGLVLGRTLFFAEDDDWYAPDYLRWSFDQLQLHDLVGETDCHYYHVLRRGLWRHNNRGHAGLSQTAMRASLIPLFRELCKQPEFDTDGEQLLDLRLWSTAGGSKMLRTPSPASPPRVVCIKGMPGRPGIGPGHLRDHPAYANDPTLKSLWGLVGEDAEAYAQFGTC